MSNVAMSAFRDTGSPWNKSGITTTYLPGDFVLSTQYSIAIDGHWTLPVFSILVGDKLGIHELVTDNIGEAFFESTTSDELTGL